ncbi:hypothetical protein B0J13DRAFT_229765 [Dactylonectria estremocensis]|uniref:Uncharacterized protein n=1 Tax=Dactylonectria estremocensis TaxID=1079267 RepID=A0A9P9F881_9HYPO|nr:hypothetical protein B0J13DRAFT_229765 [Dactylonectria estremocensis]
MRPSSITKSVGIMDALNELESLAQSSAHDSQRSETPRRETIRRYMELFDLNKTEAIDKINELRKFIPERKPAPKKKRAAAYLVRLQGTFLFDAEVIKTIAGLGEVPEVVIGTDDSGREAVFCRVDHDTRAKIATHFAENDLGPLPTFLQLTIAEKSLSPESLAPTLGLDATLPQNRASSPGAAFRPSQGEYPVWYFFYGPLANPDELKIILRLSTKPNYKPASITGGRLLAWNAIRDAVGNEVQHEIPGKAFLVRTPKEEESLRFSVTDKFEVVRCAIRFTDSGDVEDGLTLRYIGTDLR